MNPGYGIEVFWNDEDGAWIADVPPKPSRWPTLARCSRPTARSSPRPHRSSKEAA